VCTVVSFAAIHLYGNCVKSKEVSKTVKNLSIFVTFEESQRENIYIHTVLKQIKF
jgi:hypothetical protein